MASPKHGPIVLRVNVHLEDTSVSNIEFTDRCLDLLLQYFCIMFFFVMPYLVKYTS